MTIRFLPLLLLTGCVIGNNQYPRPRDLTSVTVVDRLRVLGLQAEPPEVRPGEPVTFTSLVVDPSGGDNLIFWLACPPDEAGGFGCATDLSTIPENPTPEQLADLGVIGIEPGLPPSYTADPSLLEGLDETARREGVDVTIQLAAFPADTLEAETIDYNEIEVAYKRLVVSEASTPNENPRITAFTVDGFEVPEGSSVQLDRAQGYELGIVVDPDSVQTYEYLNSEGVLEERVEEPYADWYCTQPGLDEFNTLYPYTQASWVSPDESGEVTCWAVVRDRRGGMAWASRALTIR